MHIINKNNHYMTLTKSVAEVIDVTKLQGCQVFIGTQEFYDACCEMLGLDANEVEGSDLTVWDDGLVENFHIEHYIDMTNLEESISNLFLQ